MPFSFQRLFFNLRDGGLSPIPTIPLLHTNGFVLANASLPKVSVITTENELQKVFVSHGHSQR